LRKLAGKKKKKKIPNTERRKNKRQNRNKGERGGPRGIPERGASAALDGKKKRIKEPEPTNK